MNYKVYENHVVTQELMLNCSKEKCRLCPHVSSNGNGYFYAYLRNGSFGNSSIYLGTLPRLTLLCLNEKKDKWVKLLPTKKKGKNYVRPHTNH
jgi:hypothetical protein